MASMARDRMARDRGHVVFAGEGLQLLALVGLQFDVMLFLGHHLMEPLFYKDKL